jgi:hypothetical protein
MDLQSTDRSGFASETMLIFALVSEIKDYTKFMTINSKHTHVNTNTTMPEQKECTIRRKSSLSVSVAIGTLEDENLEVMWPELSSSESSKKSARCTGYQSIDTCCTARLDFEFGTIDDSDDACSSAWKQKHHQSWDGIDANSSARWTLQKSSNLCGLVFKENRGCESWRDFL